MKRVGRECKVQDVYNYRVRFRYSSVMHRYRREQFTSTLIPSCAYGDIRPPIPVNLVDSGPLVPNSVQIKACRELRTICVSISIARELIAASTRLRERYSNRTMSIHSFRKLLLPEIAYDIHFSCDDRLIARTRTVIKSTWFIFILITN